MTSYLSTIERIQRELAKLRSDDAKEAAKEATAQSKINKAQMGISSAKTASTLKSKMSELERAIKESASAAKKRAEYSNKIAAKSKQLNDYQTRQTKLEDKSRQAVMAEQKRLTKERQEHEAYIKSALVEAKATFSPLEKASTETYDFFISHASEDKEAFVQSLATELSSLGATIFYDAFTLKIGDSLRRKIDHGLANSRFGVVILSESFFSKQWPARELDGLTAMEIGGQTRILPIWHKVSYDEVRQFSPILADKVALNTSLKSVQDIAKELYSLIDS